MPDVTLSKVTFIPDPDQVELEKGIIELLREFEEKHKSVRVFAELEITKI
jgi:hypothetical protein